MGILALVCVPIGPIFGLVTIILWASHRGKVKRGQARPDGTATAGFILGIIGSVLHAIVIVSFLVVLFSPSFWEIMTAGQLNALHEVQEKFKADNGQYATQMSQLKPYGTETFEAIAKYFSYELELSGDGSEWSCVASPTKPVVKGYKLHYFFIDQTGIIRSSETEDVGPDSPVYHTATGPYAPQKRSRGD
jgi:hypothetical protein